MSFGVIREKNPADKDTFSQQLDRLLPASKRWLAKKGYIKCDTIDDERVLEITDEGRRYFASFRKW